MITQYQVLIIFLMLFLIDLVVTKLLLVAIVRKLSVNANEISNISRVLSEFLNSFFDTS